MHSLIQYNRLPDDDRLESPSNRYALGYSAGVAQLVDRETGEVRWQAGAAGRFLLGAGDELLVEDDDHAPVWRSGLAAEGARSVVVSNGGELELLDGEGVPLLNSRTGPVASTAVPDALAAVELTRTRYLVREGKQRRTVTRNPDGSLQVSTRFLGGGFSHTLVAPLASWLEQDGTVLTWQMLPAGDGSLSRALCLVEVGTDEVRWRDHMRDCPATPPPAVPHAYGGPVLGRGGRLRHQSLASPSGAYTLVHQDDGNLVLYQDHAVWATNTWWAGDGWVDLTGDGDLVVRNACGTDVWRAGTTGAEWLAVDDDGTIALLDVAENPLWTVPGPGPAPGIPVARGSVLHRGEMLRRQSLTSADGGTVLAHRDDRRLTLFGPDGRWVWDEFVWNADRSYLVLDDDGMLRLRGEDGSVAAELGGPAGELAVLPGEVVLRTPEGTVLWRNGAAVTAADGPDFESWMDALMDDTAYCVTVVHDVSPDEALRRLGLADDRIGTGTWTDLHTRFEEGDHGFGDTPVAAFALGPHTMLVEDNGFTGVNAPEVSAGTFAVSCYRSVNADGRFAVFRDGEQQLDHDFDDGVPGPATPEVAAALAAMGYEGPDDDPDDDWFDRDLELLCRTAGVLPTVEDVTAPARIAVLTDILTRFTRRD